MPPNTLNVARPSKYGNPHRIGFCPLCGVDHTRNEAVAEFEAELSQLSANHFEVMRGKNLACWCTIFDEDGNYMPCHADILLGVANGMTQDEVRNRNMSAVPRMARNDQAHPTAAKASVGGTENL